MGSLPSIYSLEMAVTSSPVFPNTGITIPFIEEVKAMFPKDASAECEGNNENKVTWGNCPLIDILNYLPSKAFDVANNFKSEHLGFIGWP
jgi:hypothetical protein